MWERQFDYKHSLPYLNCVTVFLSVLRGLRADLWWFYGFYVAEPRDIVQNQIEKKQSFFSHTNPLSKDFNLNKKMAHPT